MALLSNLFSKRQRPSIDICCAHCYQPTDISDESVFLTGCCHNPICPECLSKSFSESTFCLICSTLQRHCDDGTLYKHYGLWELESYVDWDLRRVKIDAFFATAKRMPGFSFFLHWNRYSWKNLDTPEIAEKYTLFCQELMKKTYVHFWTRFCSIRGLPIVSPRMFACSKSYMVYSTHPFFPWVPERRKVMSRCQFGVISTIAKRLVAEKQGDQRFLMQILSRFLARS
jgi:hypothetical protein